MRALNGVPVRKLASPRRAFALNASREMQLSVSARNQPLRVVTVRW